ncbi:MAG: hypothetical protein ACYC5O_23930, partial [Anaerolineae bacterium]
PYCAALLWPESHVDGGYTTLDEAVARLNQTLSHPEQIKRWLLLANDLGTESGELTANLKLKRQVVAARHATAIAALYGEAAAPEGVLHTGMAGKG